MYKELETNTHMYKFLKKKFPNISRIYYNYYEGDYYNKAYTEYFDEGKKVIYREEHAYYG